MDIKNKLLCAIFHSYLTYVTTVWRQKMNSLRWDNCHSGESINNCVFCINVHSTSYFHDYNILKFCDIANIACSLCFHQQSFQCYLFQYLLKDIKLVSAIFNQIFIFSPNGSPLKTIKNAFYFIEKFFLFLRYLNFCNFFPFHVFQIQKAKWK